MSDGASLLQSRRVERGLWPEGTGDWPQVDGEWSKVLALEGLLQRPRRIRTQLRLLAWLGNWAPEGLRSYLSKTAVQDGPRPTLKKKTNKKPVTASLILFTGLRDIVGSGFVADQKTEQ